MMTPYSVLRPARPTRRWIARALLVAAIGLLIAPGLLPSAHAGDVPSTATPAFRVTKIAYNSSVDGFPLSYLSWLPAGYRSSVATPLVVFLHGLGAGTAPIKGGTDGDTVPSDVVRNASSHSMILISLNTRTAAGFYANTPCGGPQRQDVLDAIANEKALHKISSVYLLGFSMGTIGALEIAGHNPGLVQGIGVVAPITDTFEQLAYGEATKTLPKAVLTDFCGRSPSPRNTTAERIVAYLSVARFNPANFSGIPIYVTAGAADPTVSNNFSRWLFAQTNSTFVNSSCATAPSLGEAANCTTTFWSLAKLHPALFSFRFVYEMAGVHSIKALDAPDFFAFLSGTVHHGFLSAGYPPTTLTVLPPPP